MKIGVIGAGKWGQNVVRTLYNMGALAGVAEADSGLRDLLSSQYPDIPLYADYRPLLESDVPAVAIATPAPTHHEVAKAALQANKDVFVEKPLTLSASHASELVTLAEDRDRVLMVGHLLLYQPAIQRIKAEIEAGRIGQVFSLHQERLNLGRARSVENSLWSLGVHDVAVFLHLVGEEPSDIQVVGHSGITAEIEDDVYLHLNFASSIQAHLHVSWLWPERRRQLVVVGSRGMLVYDELAQTVTFHDKGINRDLSNRENGSTVLFEGAEQPLQLELQHFLDRILDRNAPLSDGPSGLHVVKILEQAEALLRGSLVPR